MMSDNHNEDGDKRCKTPHSTPAGGTLLKAGGAAAAAAASGGALGPRAFDFKPSQRYPDAAVEILDPSFAKYPPVQLHRRSSSPRASAGWKGRSGSATARYLLFSDIPNNRIIR